MRVCVYMCVCVFVFLHDVYVQMLGVRVCVCVGERRGLLMYFSIVIPQFLHRFVLFFLTAFNLIHNLVIIFLVIYNIKTK